jgi:hypothetical protein
MIHATVQPIDVKNNHQNAANTWGKLTQGGRPQNRYSTWKCTKGIQFCRICRSAAVLLYQFCYMSAFFGFTPR